MARPELTPQETYLLNAIKAHAESVSNVGLWSFLIATGVIALLGAYLNAMPIVFIAFCIVVGFRIFEERNHLRWAPHWRSLVEKLGACLRRNSC
ncbi:MAG: hypothetical protein JWP89_6054 [Schlesneria sp.]|nr:hypothetical protein [Schlesneria sp.]